MKLQCTLFITKKQQIYKSTSGGNKKMLLINMCTYLKAPPRIEADQIVVLNYSQSRISLNKTVFLPTNTHGH